MQQLQDSSEPLPKDNTARKAARAKPTSAFRAERSEAQNGESRGFMPRTHLLNSTATTWPSMVLSLLSEYFTLAFIPCKSLQG